MIIKSLRYVLLLGLLLSCKYDNFYDTVRILSTDKTVYNIGDEIKITMKILPLKGEKEIKVYENYKNIDFSFSIINNKDIYNGYWSSNTSGKQLPKSSIKTLIITKESPFIADFIGNITIKEDSVYIKFPKLNNYKVVFKKDIFNNADTFIRIHGISYPINPEPGASIEEFFTTEDIKINL